MSSRDAVTAARAVVILYRHLEQATRQGDITMAQYRLLLFLKDGPQRAGVLAKVSALSKATISLAVNAVRERGWVATASDDDGIEHVTAAGVTKFGAVPKDLIKVTLAPQTYAVFAHDGHVTEIRETYRAIWNDWFANSGRAPLEAPGFERHNATFDPRTGNGGCTIWLPVK